MNCDKVLYKLSSYIDNELKETEKRVIEQHINGCARCSEELKMLLNDHAYLKQLAPLKLSKELQQGLIQRINAEKGIAGRRMDIGELFARFWVPVPVISAALIMLFLGFTVLSPLLYAAPDGSKVAAGLSKAAFSNLSGKNIAGPLNYLEFCNRCHIALCECCNKGQECKCNIGGGKQ